MCRGVRLEIASRRLGWVPPLSQDQGCPPPGSITRGRLVPSRSRSCDIRPHAIARSYGSQDIIKGSLVFARPAFPSSPVLPDGRGALGLVQPIDTSFTWLSLLTGCELVSHPERRSGRASPSFRAQHPVHMRVAADEGIVAIVARAHVVISVPQSWKTARPMWSRSWPAGRGTRPARGRWATTRRRTTTAAS